MKKLLLVLSSFAGLMLIASCSKSGPALSVSDVQVVAPAPGRKASVAYLTIHNKSSDSVDLISISSPQFGRVELHETTLENGIARMRALQSISVDADASIELAPGGKHVMLFEPVKALLPGSSVSLHLNFASEATLIVQAPLKTRLSID